MVIRNPFEPLGRTRAEDREAASAWSSQPRCHGAESGLSNGADCQPDKVLAATDDDQNEMAERKGFEPSIPFRVYSLSRGAPSTTRPPLRRVVCYPSMAV